MSTNSKEIELSQRTEDYLSKVKEFEKLYADLFSSTLPPTKGQLKKLQDDERKLRQEHSNLIDLSASTGKQYQQKYKELEGSLRVLNASKSDMSTEGYEKELADSWNAMYKDRPLDSEQKKEDEQIMQEKEIMKEKQAEGDIQKLAEAQDPQPERKNSESAILTRLRNASKSGLKSLKTQSIPKEKVEEKESDVKVDLTVKQTAKKLASKAPKAVMGAAQYHPMIFGVTRAARAVSKQLNKNEDKHSPSGSGKKQ